MGTVRDDTMQRQGYGKDKGTYLLSYLGRQGDVPFVPPDPAQLNPKRGTPRVNILGVFFGTERTEVTLAVPEGKLPPTCREMLP